MDLNTTAALAEHARRMRFRVAPNGFAPEDVLPMVNVLAATIDELVSYIEAVAQQTVAQTGGHIDLAIEYMEFARSLLADLGVEATPHNGVSEAA